LAALAFSAVAGLFAAQVWGKALDDFFITYRYADNLASGHGFVFNPGERAYGTTAPGLGLLLALLHRLTRIPIPGLGTLLTALSLVTLALLLQREAERGGHGWEGLLAGSLVVTSSYIWPQHGNEIPLVLALLLLAATLAQRWPATAGLLAAGAVTCRPEAALGLAWLAVLLWRSGRRLPRRFLAAAAAVLAAGATAAWLWFGRLIPLTLEAKRHQAEWLPNAWASGWQFWPRALRAAAEHWLGWSAFLWLGLGLGGLVLFYRRSGPAGRLLVVYALSLVPAYVALGVAFYPWYPIPVVVALVYGAPHAVGALGRTILDELGGTRAARLAAALAVLAVLGPPLAMAARQVRVSYASWEISPHYDLYRRVGLWLRRNSAPAATVAYAEVGTIGFFSRRSVQDLLGLVTPRTLPYVSRGDMAGAFLTQPTDFVLYDRDLHGFTQPILDEPWFAAAYETARVLRARGSAESLTIYRRRADAPPLPPPRPPRAP
jgi:hypothetical protein